MLPGRYASIKLNKDEIQDALAVPSEAIVPEMGKDKIFLYKSGKARSTGRDYYGNPYGSGSTSIARLAGRRYHHHLGNPATPYRTAGTLDNIN